MAEVQQFSGAIFEAPDDELCEIILRLKSVDFNILTQVCTR
jgi:hypothetical protein